jgi:L-2,4-diaminobutyrate decarboxylase
MTASHAELLKAFEPAHLERTGRAVVELLSAHLARAASRNSVPVMPREGPTAQCAAFPGAFPKRGTGDVVAVLKRAIELSTVLQAPGFVGHQVATPLPDAALCDYVGSYLNNGMAIFEMGPSASAMERAVLQHLAGAAGLPSTSGGVLTSGGSLGNLTALLAARQAKAGYDAWRRGLRSGPQLTVYVAETAHYSVARALRILGLGDAGVVAVDVDDVLRMKPDALEVEIAASRRRGHRPIAVVASAGSTAVGALDPLDAIADICAREDLWFHVDGAHGASLVLSEKHKPALKGIERADSIVWDAHKMMLMPALVTAVLFRDAGAGAAAFAQEAGYLFDESGDDDDRWADVGKRTVECTKRMMSLKLYACFEAYGTDAFAAHVDRCCGLASTLASMVRERPAFELKVEPQCNIVVFRLRDGGNGVNAAVRRKVVADGRFYLVQVHRPDGLWLRTTLLNPLTTEDDLRALLDEVEAASK